MSQKLNFVFDDVMSNSEEMSSSFETIDYQMSTYIKYDFACPADHAKKILEKELVKSKIELFFDLTDASELSTLDIGCATGRYPTWFGEIGFVAYGYDIADKAIKICQDRSANLPNVFFEKKNILEDEVEEEQFNLITCMMGTFNHIKYDQQSLFIEKINKMLKPGGVLIFSSWNSSCSYTNHLQFYTRQEREYLQGNSTDSQMIFPLLDENNFDVESIQHFACLPDECYEAWTSVLDDQDVIQLDQELRNRLGHKNSQMYLVTAIKKL